MKAARLHSLPRWWPATSRRGEHHPRLPASGGKRPAAKANTAGFIQIEFLALLLLLPLGVFLFLAAEKRRLRDARRLAGARGADPDRERQRRGDFVRLTAAAALIILALARPAWRDGTLPAWREGRDIVFLLDVSRSMLAQDLAPDRLGAAKTAIRDCVESLEGDRVALVVFAGSNSVLCPLTNDYDFFLDKLEEAHPDFVSPGDVRIGGTRIGDAIHKICDKLLTAERRGFQDIVLLSDGGDQDSNPARAVQRLETLGVHFLVAGLGDAVTGARIPARTEAEKGPEFVLFKGREVWTRLESDGLNALAKACRYGVFLNAGTRPLPLGNIYQKLATHFQRHHTGEREDLMRKQELFPVFLGLAFLVLAAPGGRSRGPCALLALGLLAAFFSPVQSFASPGPSLFQTGLHQFAAKNFTGSLESFRAAAEAFPDSERRAICLYNAGLACYHQARTDEPLDPLSSQSYYRQSCASFRAALEMLPSLEDGRWNLELALRRLALLTRNDDVPADASDKADSPESKQDPSSKDEPVQDTREADRNRATQPSTQMDGQNAMDLSAQDIPPPAVEPEDILQRERESDAVRQKTSAANYRPVEKDW